MMREVRRIEIQAKCNTYTSHIAPHKLIQTLFALVLFYFALHVILPLVKSYGDNSTFTLSPGRILI